MILNDSNTLELLKKKYNCLDSKDCINKNNCSECEHYVDRDLQKEVIKYVIDKLYKPSTVVKEPADINNVDVKSISYKICEYCFYSRKGHPTIGYKCTLCENGSNWQRKVGFI